MKATDVAERLEAWTDCGVNLCSGQFSDRSAVLDRAAHLQVTRSVLIASSVEESADVIALAESESGCIATVGIHPHQAKDAPADYIPALRQLAQHANVRAVGECGLDYNRNFSPPADQRRVFAAQVALAVELELPLYLHERDALADHLAILSEHKGQLPPLFVHCFTQGPEALGEYLALDAYIGVTGWACDERRGEALRRAVPLIPDNRLLLETDAPYLIPRTIRPKPSSRVNEPRWLPEIAATVATLRNTTAKELARLTTSNAQAFFGEWPVREVICAPC